MRDTIRELWPEIDWIADLHLREQVTQTWIKALERSPLHANDLNRIPFTLLVPNCPITFMEHKRCVVHIARESAFAMQEFMGRALPIDLDTVIAGAILADVGKLLEYELGPDGQSRQSERGEALRHPFTGVALALECGVPDAVCHIIAAHAAEGELVKRSTEAFIVHHADFMAFLPFKNPKNIKVKPEGEPVSESKPISTPKETVTAKMSRWAAALQYRDLSQAAVYQAKRFLLDSFGCALGGYQQHEVKIALEVLGELAAPGSATVIGSGSRIDAVSASLANALMIRCMDYNDIYWKQDPSHPSDIFPAAIACCERAGGDGKELIVGAVLGHEFEMRLCEAAFPGIRERGWHHATLTAFVSPIVAARALHLTWEQMQHAIGISASRHCTLGAVTAGKLTMMKNTVDPMATQSGVFAALLAEKGYTGPGHVVDGKEGLTHVFGPEWRLDLLTEGLGQSWRITQCGMKAFPTEALTHTPISVVLDLVKTNDLHPDQVKKIQIRSLARAADILSDPSKYDPHTKETADHSLPYVIAAALVERQVTPVQFTMEKIMDPQIRAQLGKVEVVADPEIEKVFPALQRAIVRIDTNDGRSFSKQLDYPKGDPRNPLTDQEVEEKFSAVAEGVLSPGSQKRVKEAIWNLERAGSVSELMALMEADVRETKSITKARTRVRPRTRKPGKPLLT